MRALTVIPGVKNSATIATIPEPDLSEGSVLVETLAVGVCGTDFEITSGEYGWPPPGKSRLVLGHDWLSRVVNRTVPLDDWRDALTRQKHDVKPVIQLGTI